MAHRALWNRLAIARFARVDGARVVVGKTRAARGCVEAAKAYGATICCTRVCVVAVQRRARFASAVIAAVAHGARIAIAATAVDRLVNTAALDVASGFTAQAEIWADQRLTQSFSLAVAQFALGARVAVIAEAAVRGRPS